MNFKKNLLRQWAAFGVVFYLGWSGLVRADVRMPGLFSDNMVLQQGKKTALWGWADDGEKVTVTFRGQKVSTTAKNGQWSVTLKHLNAGGPDILTINGKNSIAFTNVLVGEVWVCGGQSNMQFEMKKSANAEPDIDSATNAEIRLFEVPKLKAMAPTNDVHSHWQVCSPQSVSNFTAVGYYFGRALQKARGVPIGLINSCWGGTPAEAWTRLDVLVGNPRYEKEIVEMYPVYKKNFVAKVAAYDQEKAEAKAKSVEFKKLAPFGLWRPSELYDGMIAPLTHYTIAGAIWYQGEGNAGHPNIYRTLFPDMIHNWRTDWAEGNFPFLFVQLAPFQAIKPDPSESKWAELCEAQLMTSKTVPKTAMAVITDVGDENNVHPKQKKPVGERLALAARAIAYGEKIPYSGPIYKSMKVKENQMVLSFDYVGGGLVAKDGPLKGFAICGDDHKFVWATAEIQGNKIVVSAPQVEHPVAVRYGWADCPVVNLWNADGLPASPFRTDDFLLIYPPKK